MSSREGTRLLQEEVAWLPERHMMMQRVCVSHRSSCQVIEQAHTQRYTAALLYRTASVSRSFSRSIVRGYQRRVWHVVGATLTNMTSRDSLTLAAGLQMQRRVLTC